jgi:hypothetical protein
MCLRSYAIEVKGHNALEIATIIKPNEHCPFFARLLIFPRSSFPIVSARSSIIRCLAPSVSYSLERSEPCTRTCDPFESVLTDSASLPNATTGCHSVRLCQLSLSSFHDSFVATDRAIAGVPFDV